MTDTRRKAALVIAGLLLLGASTASCSSTSNTAETGADGGAIPTNTKKVPVTGGNGAATCPADAMTKSVEAKYPGATMANQHVSLNAGIATIFPKDGDKKGILGYFQASADGCPLVKETAPDSDVYAAAPPDFPQSLIDQWKREYVDPTKAATTTTAASDGGGGGGGGGGNCDIDSPCVTSATTPESTTTTKPPTTTTASTTTTKPPTTTTTGPPQTIIIRG